MFLANCRQLLPSLKLVKQITCRIELKHDFEAMIRKHHAAHYSEMRLKQNLQELEGQLKAARKIANSLDIYKQKVNRNLDDATKRVAFEKICSHAIQLATPPTEQGQFTEEPFNPLEGRHLAAGVVIRLPDGK